VIDTHAHLDALEDARSALERARAAGVSRVVAVGSGIESSRAALAIAEREDGVYAALGIHPHQAGDAALDGASDSLLLASEPLTTLRDLLADPKAVAVGETGLDYFRDYAPRDRQACLFRAHVALAKETRKPLVVHTRAADDDTVAVLRDAGDEVPVVLHCFSSVGLLEPALEHGWYVSFAGNVTYPKAGELRWAAERVPADRLLVETDSPYLAPQPVRGRTNEPAHVVHTLAAVAAARRAEPGEVEAQVDENATRLFALP
jgi:TatD DNase family protein